MRLVFGWLVAVTPFGAIICFHRKIASSDACERDTSGGKTSGSYVVASKDFVLVGRRFSLPLRFPSRAHPSLALSLLPCLLTSVTACSAYIRLVGGSRRPPFVSFSVSAISELLRKYCLTDETNIAPTILVSAPNYK